MKAEFSLVESDTQRQMNHIHSRMCEIIQFVEATRTLVHDAALQGALSMFYQEMQFLHTQGSHFQSSCGHRFTNSLFEVQQDGSFETTIRCQCCYKEIK